MKSVFLSYPKPFMKRQQEFVKNLKTYLDECELKPRTMGVSDFAQEFSVSSIQNLLTECQGMLILAFRRTYIESGVSKPHSDLDELQCDISNSWLTSPWCYIEASMAIQNNIPIMIIQEEGVIYYDMLIQEAQYYVTEFNLKSNPANIKELSLWLERIKK